MYYLIFESKVVQKADKPFPIHESFTWVESEDLNIVPGDWEYKNGYFEKTPKVIFDYRESRLQEYPSIGTQLDYLWHAMDNGEIPKASEFYNALKTIKEKFPKPN